MKNSRIVRAYDSINPCPADKQRMLDAILAEADLPEEPKARQPRKKQEPVIYKKKPDPKPRRGSWIGPLVACLLMAVLCGFVLSFVASRQSLDPAYVDPSVVITGTPYDVVLNKYKTALEEEWTVDQCRIQDICSHVLTANYSVLDVGYAMKDLDGNGREELLITNGQGLVWDLYTLAEDGSPVHVHRQEDGWPVYRIYENGIICAEYFDSGRIFSYYVYQDGEFTGPELVIRQSSAMFTFEPAGQEPYFISEEEAEAKMAEYKIQELDQRSLLSLVSEDIAEKYRYGNNSAYAKVIEKYNRAISENWTKEQCQIEGISTRFYLPEPVDFTIGQRMRDINGDGRAELLIGHDDNIWDLYTTLEDGTPIQLLSDEQDGWQYYLCEGQLILAEYYSKDDCYVEYYHLDGHQLVLYQELQYEDGQWQYRLDGQEWQPMSERDVQTLTNGYKHIQPDWIPLENENTADSFRDIIYRYMRAADEGWDRAMCLENGMSELTPVGPDEGLYYAMFDLNGDGTEELIISEYPYRENTDTKFIDIYAMVDGTVRNVMSVKEEDMWSLCVHGYIKDISPAQRPEWNKYASYWQFQGNHFVQQFAVGQKDDQWFTEGYRGVGAAITREEADEIVANYPPQKLDFQIIQSVPEESYTGFEGYDFIVSKYVEALTENWSEQQCQANDISPEIFADTTVTHNLGWCLLDIDKNGTQELVISDGVNLFDLYVMMPHDGGPGHLIMANGSDNYKICQDGTIEKQMFFSKSTSWYYYDLHDWDLDLKNVLTYRNEYQGTQAAERYYLGTSDDNAQSISKEEAGSFMAKYPNMELNLTYFVPQTFDPDEVQHYQSVLELYQKALREDWNPGQCMENGLSLMVAHRGEYYEDLGYAMQDLDGNGIDELIITDGLNIYDLYTIIQDEEEGPLHLVSAMERIQYYLTTDGWIYNMGSGGAAVSYHTLYALEGRELKLLEGYMMDANTDPNNPWFYYDGENQLGKCPTAEAAEAMDSIVFAEIPFTPFQ